MWALNNLTTHILYKNPMITETEHSVIKCFACWWDKNAASLTLNFHTKKHPYLGSFCQVWWAVEIVSRVEQGELDHLFHIFRVSWHACYKYHTLFWRKNSSPQEPLVECTGKYRLVSCAANCVALGLGQDAQSCRHNISEYTVIITGKATAHRNGVVAKQRLYLNSFYP